MNTIAKVQHQWPCGCTSEVDRYEPDNGWDDDHTVIERTRVHFTTMCAAHGLYWNRTQIIEGTPEDYGARLV